MNKFSLISQYRGLRKEIYVLCIGRIVTSLGSMVWPMLTLMMSQKMGFDASTIAVVMVGSSVIMIPANVAGGRLADKLDKRRLIIICDIVSITCFIACGLVPLSIATMALMIVAAIFQSIEGPSYEALVADLTKVSDRERVYSLSYLCINLGMVLAPTLSGILFKNFIWLMFIINGVSIAFSTFLIFSFIKDVTPVEDRSEEAEYQNKKSNEGLFRILKRNKAVFLFIIAVAVYYAAYGQWGYLLPLDMGRVHGENGALIYGTVSSFNCIIVVFFTPIITKLFGKFVETKKLLAGEILLAVGYAMFLLMLGIIPVYYAAMFMFTFGEIFATIAEGPYVTRRFPASHRGRINGMRAVIGTVISGVTQLAVGTTYDRFGNVVSWIIVLSLLASSAVMTLILIGKDRKEYPKLYRKQ